MASPLSAKLRRLRRDDKGATAIEYALIAALIGVAATSGMYAVGGELAGSLTRSQWAVEQAN